MNIPSNDFLHDKRDFMLQCLALGAAIECACDSTGFTPDELLGYLTQLAEDRMLHQTSESIDELVNQYKFGKINKVKTIIARISKTA